MAHSFLGIRTLYQRQNCNSSCNHGFAGKWLGLFRTSFGPLCGSVEELRGCGRVRNTFTTNFFTVFTLKNSKEFSQSLAITTNVCPSKPNFGGLVVWREVSCLAPSFVYPFRGLFLQFVTGFGHGFWRGLTHMLTGRGCLSKRFRAPQNGSTPLHLAAITGHASVTERLLAAGAVTDAKSKVRWVGGAGCK